MTSSVVALALVPSLVVSLVACYVVRLLAPRLGLVDQPGHRKIHARAVPYGGGIGIWLGVVLPLLVGQGIVWSWSGSPDGSLDLSRYGEFVGRVGQFIEPHLSGLASRAGELWFFIAAATVLMLLGLADDLWKINWRWRLAVEFIVAAAVVYIPGWRLTLFVELPLLTDLITILWIVGLVNSINFLDNMDALAGGVSAIAAALLAVYMLIVPEAPGQPQLFIAGFLFLLTGSLAGFLWHNRPPARLFMGDAGSYFVGFSLAVMTTLATFSGPGIPRHSILAPVCVLAVPLYDTLSVVVIRLRNGRSPFEGDTNHFSHRLVALGLSKVQAVLTIYLTTAACGLGALVLPQVDSAGAAMIVLVIGCLLGVIAILEVAARRRSQER
jgi:UDP-GlcNAc:undecaprenyl-phosphate GlcNAc-1-phosphate transferase